MSKHIDKKAKEKEDENRAHDKDSLKKEQRLEEAEKIDKEEEMVTISQEEYNMLKAKEKESKAGIERLLRLQADFDNARKRLERDKLGFIKFANEEIILEILTIVDDFDRAVEAGKSKHDFDVLYKGVEMIAKDLKEFLKQKGVEEIEAKGKLFNPHEHDAMMPEETDKHPEDHVVEEFQKGYTLNGRVIRPAKVKVAKKPVNQEPEKTNDENKEV